MSTTSIFAFNDLPPVGSFSTHPPKHFQKDEKYERLHSQILDFNAALPNLNDRQYLKAAFETLCHDLGILYNQRDKKNVLLNRLLNYVC